MLWPFKVCLFYSISFVEERKSLELASDSPYCLDHDCDSYGGGHSSASDSFQTGTAPWRAGKVSTASLSKWFSDVLALFNVMNHCGTPGSGFVAIWYSCSYFVCYCYCWHAVQPSFAVPENGIGCFCFDIIAVDTLIHDLVSVGEILLTGGCGLHYCLSRQLSCFFVRSGLSSGYLFLNLFISVGLSPQPSYFVVLDGILTWFQLASRASVLLWDVLVSLQWTFSCWFCVCGCLGTGFGLLCEYWSVCMFTVTLTETFTWFSFPSVVFEVVSFFYWSTARFSFIHWLFCFTWSDLVYRVSCLWPLHVIVLGLVWASSTPFEDFWQVALFFIGNIFVPVWFQ